LTNHLAIPDLHIIQLVQSGDTTGLDLLYEKYAPALYTLTVQIVGSREKSNTIIINVFRALTQTIKSYDPGQSSLFVWLMRQTRTAALQQVKKTGSRSHMLKPVDGQALVSVVQKPSLTSDEVGLRKILNDLDDNSRNLIDLHYFQGCEIAEISERTLLPLDITATQVRQALVLFHKKLVNAGGR